MTDIPIMFSAPMILALLDGTKTMTRRLASHSTGRPARWRTVVAGDRLWVREAMRAIDHRLIYAADKMRISTVKQPDDYVVTRDAMPSMFMPRWASRMTLTVTAARIERLQDISAADVAAEGVSGDGGPGLPGAFMSLWEKLHGHESWAANPEVVVISFTARKRNIDAISNGSRSGEA
jgi:hypothetical protein